MTLLTGDEFMELLEARRAEWEAAHPTRSEAVVERIKRDFPDANPVIRPRFEVRPLLEWFIKDGDDDIVDPVVFAPAPPQPKREHRPRTYRSAASLREERDRVQARRDAITADDDGYDPAIVNLSPRSRNRAAARAGRRRFAKLDRDLARYTQLTRRLASLDSRIIRAEAREARAAS